MNIFIRIKAALRLRRAISIALKAYHTTGRRHYVIPQYNSAGRRLLVIDRRNFRLLKLKHYITTRAHVIDLQRECFYHTPHKGGIDPIHPQVLKTKQKQYFSWVATDPR